MSDLLKKWRESLTKTRDVAFGKVSTFFGATQITEDSWDELEALLIQADLGVETTIALINNCQEQVDRQGLTKTEQLYSLLKSELVSLLDQPAEPDFSFQPTVIMIAGVNG